MSDDPNPNPNPNSDPAPAYYEAFADEALKTSPSIQRYKTPEDLGRAYVNLEKRFGVPPERLLTVPEKPDDAAGWDALHSALGRPKTAAEYQIGLAEGASEGDKAFVEGFRERAHKAGYSQSQVATAVEYLNETTKAAAEAATTARETETKAVQGTLKTEWGDKYAVYGTEIGKLITELGDKQGEGGGQKLLDELNEKGLGNSLGLNRLLAQIVDMRAEPGKLPGADGQADTGDRPMTPTQAKSARMMLEADPVKGKALMDATDPMHAVVIEERRKLLRYENPQQKAS